MQKLRFFLKGGDLFFLGLVTLSSLIFFSKLGIAGEEYATLSRLSFQQLTVKELLSEGFGPDSNDTSHTERKFLEGLAKNRDEDTVIRISKFSGVSENFIIVNFQSFSDCGNSGCSNSIFLKKENDEYIRIYPGIVANGPIYKKLCKTGISLIFSPGPGMNLKFSVWNYTGDAFSLVSQHTTLQDTFSCN